MSKEDNRVPGKAEAAELCWDRRKEQTWTRSSVAETQPTLWARPQRGENSLFSSENAFDPPIDKSLYMPQPTAFYYTDIFFYSYISFDKPAVFKKALQ